MSYQPVAPGPVQRGDPAAYSHPVDNSSAPRVGCFVDDGSCNGGQAYEGDANVFNGERSFTNGGYPERALSNNEGDVVELELPAGSPSPPALKEVRPASRATLKSKTNYIAIVPVVADKTNVPAYDRDSKGVGDESRPVALPKHGDENVDVTAFPSLESSPRDTQRGEYKWLLDAPEDTAHTAGQSVEYHSAIDSEDGVEDRPMSPFMLPPPMMQEPKEEPERIVQGTFDEILESLPPVKSAFDDLPAPNTLFRRVAHINLPVYISLYPIYGRPA